ncbi:MAG: tetratricopeptide repeat protein [Methylomonas sp.]|nr:tetratricopeptide repeat protein [Methylomonas sp.]
MLRTKIYPLTLLILLYFAENTAMAGSSYYPGKPAPWVGTDFNGLPCIERPQTYGPYDYTNETDRAALKGGGNNTALEIVEAAHFRPESENLIKARYGSFLADYDYTLRAWPNHHRALFSLARFQIEVNKKIRKPEKEFSQTECYFQRAINFNPEDAAARSLYAYLLEKIGKPDEAQKQYEKALEVSPNSSKIAYAYSLFLIEIKQYDKALELAQRAYKNGKPPMGLQNKLKKLGVWK